MPSAPGRQLLCLKLRQIRARLKLVTDSGLSQDSNGSMRTANSVSNRNMFELCAGRTRPSAPHYDGTAFFGTGRGAVVKLVGKAGLLPRPPSSAWVLLYPSAAPTSLQPYSTGSTCWVHRFSISHGCAHHARKTAKPRSDQSRVLTVEYTRILIVVHSPGGIT